MLTPLSSFKKSLISLPAGTRVSYTIAAMIPMCGSGETGKNF